MNRLRFMNAGESHGPELTAILEGLPAGLEVDVDAINAELARRQRGLGAGARMKIERDRVRITAGVMAGKTTGGPVAMRVTNRDWANWAERDIDPMTVPRPGHADLTGALKYGYDDLRLSLERSSARETTTRVAAGALCKQLLGALGVRVGGYAVRIGSAQASTPPTADVSELQQRVRFALENNLAWPSEDGKDAARKAIEDCIQSRDTLGGVFEVVAWGLPAGLGSYAQWDRRLDAAIAHAMLSIQAMKGVEIGPAFENATRPGTEVQDTIHASPDGQIERGSNRSGGLEGGVTNGEPLLVRVAMKPLSSTLTPLTSVDLREGDAAVTTYERSDFCALPRAVPIGESMLALVLADALLTKLGGDSLGEMLGHLALLRRPNVDDVELHGQPWRFGPPLTDSND